MKSAPAGFVLLWASIDGGLYLAWYWGGTLDSGPSDSGLPPLLWTGAVAAFAAALLGGAVLQAKLLRVCGRPVDRWALRVGAGHGVLWGCSRLYFSAVQPLYAGPIERQFAIAAAAEVGYGLIWALGLGIVLAASVWGRSWPASWKIWLAGRIILQLAVQIPFIAGLFHAVNRDLHLLRFQALAYAVQGFVLGGGTAWLLWRLVLPSPQAVGSP